MSKRILIFIASFTAVLAATAGSALAQGQAVCIKPGAPIAAPGSGGCPKSYASQTLATESEVTALQNENTALKTRVSDLEAKLSKVSYSATGLNGLPTLKIDGANLQIVSGSGATDGAVNGLGNLVIGYDENPDSFFQQTGSHNLILGSNQTFTSYGGVMGGNYNVLSGASSVVFGVFNTASGNPSFVVGKYNTASGLYSSVSGGHVNTASNDFSSVSGGTNNIASGPSASILGGNGHTVSTIDGTYPAGP